MESRIDGTGVLRLIFLFFQRYLVQGFAHAGLKG